MSWWVGKDRDAFSESLKQQTDRIMRQGQLRPNARRITEPPTASSHVVVASEPYVGGVTLKSSPVETEASSAAAHMPDAVTRTCERCGTSFTPKVGTVGRFCSRACYDWKKHRAYREKNVAAGKCARCGKPRGEYAYNCPNCQAVKTAYVREREGYRPWMPGSRGPAPKALRPIMLMARGYKRAIETHPEAQSHALMGRAAVVMVVGFLFRQRIDWIAKFTGYREPEIRSIAERLLISGTWTEDGKIACEWGDMLFTDKKFTKRKQYEADVAFWLDALAATGEIRRETRNGQFFYMAV